MHGQTIHARSYHRLLMKYMFVHTCTQPYVFDACSLNVMCGTRLDLTSTMPPGWVFVMWDYLQSVCLYRTQLVSSISFTYNVWYYWGVHSIAVKSIKINFSVSLHCPIKSKILLFDRSHFNGGFYQFIPDRGIVRTYRRSDGISIRPDGQNTLTRQSADTNNAPRYPPHVPITWSPARTLPYSTLRLHLHLRLHSIMFTSRTVPLRQEPDHCCTRYSTLAPSSALASAVLF